MSLPNGTIAALRRGGASYYLFDGLGSVVAMTDSTGAVKNRYTYDPYGNLTTTSESPGLEQRYRYTGQYQDPDTGLYKLGLRYGDPTLDRFTQQDPHGDNPTTRTDNPYGNRYIYAGCNPTNATDPSGASHLGCEVGIAGAAATAAAAAGGLFLLAAGGPITVGVAVFAGAGIASSAAANVAAAYSCGSFD